MTVLMSIAEYVFYFCESRFDGIPNETFAKRVDDSALVKQIRATFVSNVHVTLIVTDRSCSRDRGTSAADAAARSAAY